MTAIIDPALITPEVDAATDRVAAAEHLPADAAHDLVNTVAGRAAAAKLRAIAADARETVRSHTGTYRVVRADSLLLHAQYLDTDAADRERDVTTRHANDTAGAWETEAHHLRAEVDMLRAQLGAVIDEIVARRLAVSNIGEHPLTPAQYAAHETDVRTTWAAIALRGTR